MSSRRQRIRSALSALFVFGVMGWICWEIGSEASTYDWSTLQPQLLPLLCVPPLLLGLYVFRAALWTWLVHAMGTDIPWTGGNRVFLAAQLGRYLPGKVWQIAGAGALAKHYGASPRICAVAALVSVVMHQMVGGAIGMLVIGEALPEATWGVPIALACLLAGLVFIASPLLPKSIGLLGRILKRPQLAELEPAPPKVLVLIALGQSLIWCGFGLALWLTAVGLFPDLPTLDPVLALGAMAASAVLGFAVLFAPSGLGVREAILIALLEPSLGLVAAGFVAIASRILMTVTELSLSLWGAWPHLRAGRRLTETAQDPVPADAPTEP